MTTAALVRPATTSSLNQSLSYSETHSGSIEKRREWFPPGKSIVLPYRRLCEASCPPWRAPLSRPYFHKRRQYICGWTFNKLGQPGGNRLAAQHAGDQVNREHAQAGCDADQRGVVLARFRQQIRRAD